MAYRTAATGMLAALVTTVAVAADLEVGAPVPVGALPDAATGEPRSLAGLRGTKVMLHVFASW